MNKTSRIITGTIMIVLGLVLTILGFFIGITLIYGIPLLILGVIIFLNKEEDKIEERKDLLKGGKKK